MAHIHTQPGQHDLTASAFIVRIDGPEPRILLHMHKKLGKWMHVGGHVELHENPWTGVIREIREESGYELDQLRLLQPEQRLVDLGDRSIAHPMPFILGTHPYGDEDHYHIDATYALVTEEEPRHPVGKDESDNMRPFTRKEIEALTDDEVYANLRIQALYVLDTVLKEWKQVKA